MIEPIPFAGLVKMPTKRQTEVAELVVKFFEDNGRAPTTRELAKLLGCSQNNAWRLMQAVQKSS
jgi:MarR-like DNA-binding transcriptional regulator SgrR of sgrS sRNA